MNHAAKDANAAPKRPAERLLLGEAPVAHEVRQPREGLCREDEEPLERFNRPVSHETPREDMNQVRAVASENDDGRQHEGLRAGRVVDIHEVEVNAPGTNICV